MLQRILSTFVYILCFMASWYGMSSIQYEKFLKKDHVVQAQILYILLCASIAYLSGSFVLSFTNFS